MEFDINSLYETLPVMGKGMLGIFIVTIVIVAIMYILREITKEKNK